MRTTLVLDDNLMARVKNVVPPRKLSQFVNRLLEEKIQEMEKRELLAEMKQGYIATRENRRELNREWDAILAEKWE
jgi:metal-responsive CopG/Arc/MetJ family transcriptional regulator